MRSAVALLLLLAACGREAPKKERLLILMHNKTGGHMNNFDLDTGSGHIRYQIFSQDYTFKEEIAVAASSRLRLGDRALDWTVEPAHNGGTLTITFLPDNKETFSFQPVADVQPKASAEENIADARKMYDALSIGMTVDEAGRIMGLSRRPERKYTWAKDYGWSLKPECVGLSVNFVDDKVVRVEIAYPYGPNKGKVVAEKGISRAQFDAR